jgi:hypothetical protein
MVGYRLSATRVRCVETRTRAHPRAVIAAKALLIRAAPIQAADYWFSPVRIA